jgi:hypothetical protein
VEIEGTFNRTLLRSKVGERIVGAAFHGKQGGVLLFLPPINLDAIEDDDQTIEGRPESTSDTEEHEAKGDSDQEGEDDEPEDSEESWTPSAIQFGKRLVVALVGLANTLKQSVTATPPPDWSMTSQYRLAAEAEVELAISERANKILKLQSEKAALEISLVDTGKLRGLLYEQGTPLESAVLEAMKLFGFDAQPFAGGDSEFDGVFVSPEGRLLGEAEGKDNKAINIDKFSQLERNLQEDFQRDEITEHAKGVLFGNAFRLKPLDDRGEFFTAKCVSAARRIDAALVRTPDLFAPAKYLKENPSDTAYAQKCRLAIFVTAGTLVEFPPPPILETATSVESIETKDNTDSVIEGGVAQA